MTSWDGDARRTGLQEPSGFAGSTGAALNFPGPPSTCLMNIETGRRTHEMSITAMATDTVNATQTQRPHHGGAMRKVFSAAADALGMSVSDLRGALKGGQTMSSLAQSKGISVDTLTSAISSALQKGNSSLSSDQATGIANQIASGTGFQQSSGVMGAGGRPPGPPPGPPPGGGPSKNQVDTALSAVADALNGLDTDGTEKTTEDDLLQQLQSGKSLKDIATAGGMTTDQLTSTIMSVLKKADSSLSDSDASALAYKIIDGPPKPRFEQYTRMALNNTGSSTGSTSGTSANSWDQLKALAGVSGDHGSFVI
jgi:hypothetical protein